MKETLIFIVAILAGLLFFLLVLIFCLSNELGQAKRRILYVEHLLRKERSNSNHLT